MSPACGRSETVWNRREFLRKSAFGFGSIALYSLLRRDGLAGTRAAPASPLKPKAPHQTATARSVILLFMSGGPSHIDTFDPKPELSRRDGQPLPASFAADDLELQFMKATDGKLMGSPFRFQRYGGSGLEISELFSNVGRHADDLAVVRSCYHDAFIHGPALSLLHCGSPLLGHPSLGAWVVYGLGSESENLPGYIAMTDSVLTAGPAVSFGSGYLPAAYQGTQVRTTGAPLQNLEPALSSTEQRTLLDAVRKWNRRHLESRADDTRLAARIANYELAFRMQAAAPELMDLSREPGSIREMYGTESEVTGRFGRMCLLSRRMVERGVRFVQLYNSDWDGHGECAKNHETNARKIDRPIAALLTDLKQRGLLDSTLVIWAGEFGRTPVMQGKGGRDHNPYGFTIWMAGGSVRGGQVIGATDEFGFRAVEDRLHVHDLHATILGLLGIDHERLTYFFEGRERRLTDVAGYNGIADRLRTSA